MKKAKLTLTIILIAAITLGIAFYVWSKDSYQPMQEALATSKSLDYTIIENDRYISFTPKNSVKDTAFIFYPGGKVAPEAYIPLLKKISEAGYKTYIVRMPLNLAVFNINGASKIAAGEKIDKWVIGGHSLGGSMAAKYAYDNPDKVDGLVLWASYPAKSNDFSNKDIPIASIYGTKDMGIDKIKEYKYLLPQSTFFTVIEGGNHAQFGYYGAQKGDNEADISREEQVDLIVKATVEFLDGVDK